MHNLSKETEELLWGGTHEWQTARLPANLDGTVTNQVSVRYTTDSDGVTKREWQNQWCNYFLSHPTTLKELEIFDINQDLFDVICEHKSLERLFIKGGSYKNIDKTVHLQNLETLYLEGGSHVQSIDVLLKLRSLKKVSLISLHDVHDYSVIQNLELLEILVLMAHPFQDKFIHIDTLDFLRYLQKLRSLVVMVARVGGDGYEPVLELQKLEYLMLGGKRRIDKIRDRIELMPSLKEKYLDEK